MYNDYFVLFIMLIVIYVLTEHIVDQVKGPQVTACSVTFKDFNGNKHTYIGTGEVWK